MYLILNYSLDMKLGITGADLVTVWTWSLPCVLVWVCSRLLLKESIKELILFCCFGSRRIYKSVIYLYLRRHSQIAFLLHSNFFFSIFAWVWRLCMFRFAPKDCETSRRISMFINPILTFCFDLVSRVQNARDKGAERSQEDKKKGYF